MTFLEALYGSQYYEISQRGSDGNKGRLNANLFLSVFINVIIFILIALCITFSTSFEQTLNASLSAMSGGMEGKTLGKLLALPLLGIIYFTVSRTVGSETNFSVYVDRFMQYSDDVKQKANVILLVPFFTAVVLLLILSLINLHSS